MERCASVVGKSEFHHAKYRRCESLLLSKLKYGVEGMRCCCFPTGGKQVISRFGLCIPQPAMASADLKCCKWASAGNLSSVYSEKRHSLRAGPWNGITMTC